MPQARIDWSVLRRAVGVFTVSLLISALLLGASFYFRDEMMSVYNGHQARFTDVSRKYLAVDQEEKVIKEYYPAFVNLYKQGILGQEHRLNWLETLRTAADRVRIPELVYKIESQESFQPDFSVATGGYELYASKMKLNLGLLHEYDLINLLKLIDLEAEGLYSVKRCDLRKPREDIVIAADATNLTAECELDWYTVDLLGDPTLEMEDLEDNI